MVYPLRISLVALLLAIPALAGLALVPASAPELWQKIGGRPTEDDPNAPRVRPFVAEGNDDWCRTIPAACPRVMSRLGEDNDDARPQSLRGVSQAG